MDLQSSLFDTDQDRQRIELADGFYLLPAFVDTAPLRAQIHLIAQQAAFRHMQVGGGKRMSVAMTNCGQWGWTSSSTGYRYSDIDPLTDLRWPEMPGAFQALARSAAVATNLGPFEPDACLVNRYAAGASLGIHQDRDELDLRHPIVSVSIGASADFQVGGLKRSEPWRSVPLNDGDVLVWGGPSRLRFHGVKALKPMLGGPDTRHNLTFRKAK